MKTILISLPIIAVLLSGCATGGSTVNVNYKSNQHSDGAEVNQTTEAVVTPTIQ